MRHFILLFLASTHRLVVELSALLLKLVITHIESVPAKAIVPHLSLDHVIVVRWVLSKHLLLLEPVSCVIIIDIVRVVL